MSGRKSPNRAGQLTFKALKTAVEQDKVRLYLDYAKVNRPQSPVYDPWECLLPTLLPVLIGLAMVVCVGVIFGLLFIAGMIVVYSTYFKKKLHHRLIDRTKKYMVDSFDNMEKLWDFGGIVLVNADNKTVGCVSPEGDWKEFVIKNFSEFMVEKDDDKKDKQPKAKNES